MRLRAAVTSLAVAALVLIACRAGAYVLAPEQILDFMIRDLGRCRTLEITHRVLHYDKGVEASVGETTERLWYAFPDRFRTEIASEHADRVMVVSPAGVVKLVNGRIAGESEERFDHYKDLLLYRSKELLQGRLGQLGVDMDVSSLGRWEGRIAYVIGARYPDTTCPQVWIDKATFRPLRWILTRQVGADSRFGIEFHYDRWRSLDGKCWYPARIACWQDGRLVEEMLMETFSLEPVFSKDRFDVQHLKLVHPPLAPEVEDRSSTDAEEVHKAVEDFRKIFR